MNINQKTFCAAPWFSIRNENRGEYRACCAIDSDKSEFKGQRVYNLTTAAEVWLNSDYMKYLREKLTTGSQLPECSACWHKESYGLQSLRLSTNNSVTDNRGCNLAQTWIASYLKNKQDFKVDLLVAADIKINNLCNYECVMCNPADSSQIYTRWINTKNEFVQDYVDRSPSYFQIIKDVYMEQDGEQLLHDVLSKPLKFLKLLGGEPLLNKKLLNLLSSLPEKKKKTLSLSFVTNGSVDLVKVVQQLGAYKHINFSLSLEAVGDMQEYVRKNSNWNQISANVDHFLNHVCKSNNQLSMEILTVAQPLTAWHYPELKQWADIRNLHITTTILQHPEYLSFTVLPESVAEQIVDQLEKIPTADLIAPAIINEIKNRQFDPEMFEKFCRYIKWFDPSLQLLSYSPIWKRVIP